MPVGGNQTRKGTSGTPYPADPATTHYRTPEPRNNTDVPEPEEFQDPKLEDPLEERHLAHFARPGAWFPSTCNIQNLLITHISQSLSMNHQTTEDLMAKKLEVGILAIGSLRPEHL